MLKLPGSIRLNLILVVLAGVLPVLAVVLGSGWERRQHEIDHAGLATMRLAKLFAHQQVIETTRLRAILVALSEDRAVRELDIAACNRLFLNTLTANPHYVNFALMAPDGEALASALPFTRQNLAERREFTEAVRTGSFAVGEYSIGKVSGAQILPFAYPIRDGDGHTLGVLIATLGLQDLSALFKQSLMPPGSFVGLVDRYGVRLYRYPLTSIAPVGKMPPPKVWSKIRAANPTALFSETGVDGVRRIYATANASLGQRPPYLHIVVGIPERAALAQADAITKNNLRWLAGSLLLSVGLAWLVGKFGIHDRLDRIAQTAQRLGAGTLSARSGLTETRGSLGLLARSMDKMAQSLEADRASLIRATEAGEREAKRLSALMELSGDGIVIIDGDYRIVEANRRFADMLGYSPREVVGLFTWDYDAEFGEERIRAQFPTPALVHDVFETRHRRKDGTTFPVEVSAYGNVIFGQSLIMCVVRDITERKRAEQALLESEERYRTLFENSLDAIAVQEGIPPRFTWVNPAFCKLFGYTAEEVYALPAGGLWELVYPEDREAVRESLLQRLAGIRDAVRYRFRIRCKNGDVRWVDVTGRRLRGAKRMNMSLYRDVTEEQETRDLLALAKTQAETASRAKSTFLANMSHEIRTPLNGIIGMLQLLQDARLEPEQANYARMALKASERLTRLLSDILDISRIEAGKMVLAEAPFPLRRTIQDIVELLLPVAKQTDVRCHIDVDARIADIVIGDAPRLQQILTNLVGNALKFTRHGSIRIELYPLPIAEPDRCRILFSVADTGSGIEPEKLDALFQPFTQGSQGFRRDHQGAGLGLAICKRLVDLMGGTLTVESEPGVGTTFLFCLTFDLPRTASSEAPAVRSRPPKAQTGLTVLLAEDDALSQLATRMMLEKNGHAVTLAEDGRLALDRLVGNDFDVVLMDIQMPVMDGLEAMRRIRGGEAGADKVEIPIIALTAYSMAGDRERFLAAGMDDAIAKPVDQTELHAAIDRVLAARSARPEA